MTTSFVIIMPGGEQHPLTDGATICRSSACTIQVHDPRASRLHATICFNEDGTLTLTDEHSSNGTLVNGYPVRQPAALRPGDVITIGNMKLIVTLTGQSQATETGDFVTVPMAKCGPKLNPNARAYRGGCWLPWCLSCWWS